MHKLYVAFSGLLHNPHQYAAAVLAKLGINFATILWSVIVLAREDALGKLPGYARLTSLFHEDVVAAGLLVISIIASARLFTKARPMALGAIVYGLLCLYWLFLWSLLVIDIWNGMTPLRPGQFSTLTLTALCGLFAFIANPKRPNDC